MHDFLHERGQQTLVETLGDALWTLQESNIEYLYLPEYSKLLKLTNKLQETDNPE